MSKSVETRSTIPFIQPRKGDSRPVGDAVGDVVVISSKSDLEKIVDNTTVVITNFNKVFGE